VSPSWRDRLRVGLCPERLVLAGYRRGLRPRLARKEIVALPPPAGADAAPWRGAVEALRGALAAGAPRPIEVSVILSNHFVHYAVLPWSKALESAEDWRALARHRFAAAHGPAAADWELRLSHGAPRGARVACAVSAELLAALAEAVAAAGARLAAVQPHLMAAFNRVRRRLGASCWLAVEEPGRLVLALISDGEWRAIRSRRVEGDWRAQESELLEREAALLALPEPRPPLVVPAAGAPAEREWAMALG
jgi:hypothetical protein